MNNSALSFLTNLNPSSGDTATQMPTAGPSGDGPEEGVNPFFTAFSSLADQSQKNTGDQPVPTGLAKIGPQTIPGPIYKIGQQIIDADPEAALETAVTVDAIKGRIAIVREASDQFAASGDFPLSIKAVPTTDPIVLSAELSGEELILPLALDDLAIDGIEGVDAANLPAGKEALPLSNFPWQADAFLTNGIQPFGKFSVEALKAALAPDAIAQKALNSTNLGQTPALVTAENSLPGLVSVANASVANSLAGQSPVSFGSQNLQPLAAAFQTPLLTNLPVTPDAEIIFDEATLLSQLKFGNVQPAIQTNANANAGNFPASQLTTALNAQAFAGISSKSVDVSATETLELADLDLENVVRLSDTPRGDRSDRLMPALFGNAPQMNAPMPTLIPLAVEQFAREGGSTAQLSLEEAALINQPLQAGGERAVPQMATQQAAPAATAVIGQVFAAISNRGGDSRIEVRLDPPELGRVVIGFEGAGAEIVRAVVSADSQQTLDLLRRNLDMLQRELERAGLEDVNVELADSETQQGAEDTTDENRVYSMIEDSVEQGEDLRHYAVKINDGRLDLRV